MDWPEGVRVHWPRLSARDLQTPRSDAAQLRPPHAPPPGRHPVLERDCSRGSVPVVPIVPYGRGVEPKPNPSADYTDLDAERRLEARLFRDSGTFWR
jgi:hypothetical protein